jgi:threonine/homoserine/homoserine lactone efflux protein
VVVSLAAFTLAAVLIVLLPGPDTLVVVRSILRVVGAGYLVWLGIQAWRSRGRVEELPHRSVLGTGFRAGILTNLLNPKVGVFFVAFLPGFIPKGEPVGLVSLLLGAIFVALTALYWVVLLGVAGAVMRWMGTPSVRRRIDAATALVFIGFGLRLATE